jgi:hypothetical protein
MYPITAIPDLDEARLQPRALVFLWVNWAGQARQSEIVVRKLVEKWHSAHPTVPIPVYRVDLSDQSGEVWEAISSWLQSEGRPVDRLTFGGYGSLLWITSGSIIAHSIFPAATEQAKLFNATVSIFGLPQVFKKTIEE